MVLLGSATPSLETYYNSTVTNKYHLHIINERYGEAILPKIKIIDMNKIQNTFIGKHILSPDLINQINLTIKRKEQILILHNRRGFSSLQICNKSNDIVKNHGILTENDLKYHEARRQRKVRKLNFEER